VDGLLSWNDIYVGFWTCVAFIAAGWLIWAFAPRRMDYDKAIGFLVLLVLGTIFFAFVHRYVVVPLREGRHYQEQYRERLYSGVHGFVEARAVLEPLDPLVVEMPRERGGENRLRRLPQFGASKL